MAYEPPTFEEFVTRYPQFGSVEGALIQAVIDEATGTVGQPETTRWLERDYAPAIMLLTAHTLIVDGALTGGTTSAAGQYAGPITREKVGEVEITYGSGSSSSGGGSTSASGLAATVYGQRYLVLMRGNFGGPMVA